MSVFQISIQEGQERIRLTSYVRTWHTTGILGEAQQTAASTEEWRGPWTLFIYGFI